MKTKNRNLLLTCASAAALLTVFSASVSAAGVAPPPLPPGSPMVKVEAGASPAEATRTERAHKHGKLRNKDYMRPDVAPAPDSGTTNSPAAPPNSPSR